MAKDWRLENYDRPQTGRPLNTPSEDDNKETWDNYASQSGIDTKGMSKQDIITAVKSGKGATPVDVHRQVTNDENEEPTTPPTHLTATGEVINTDTNVVDSSASGKGVTTSKSPTKNK